MRTATSRSTKVLILSSARALTALVGLLSAAILTRLFTQGDFATYRQAILTFTFATPFLSLGLDQALYHFLPGERHRSRGILLENLLLLLIGGALLSLFVVAGGNRLLAARFDNPDLVWILRLMAPYPLFVLPAAALTACLMSRERTAEVAWFNMASRLSMLLIVILPCLIWASPVAALAGTLVGAALAAIGSVVLMLRACPEGPWRPTLAGIKQQLAFSIPLGLAGMGGTVSRSLDQVFVAARCPPEVFAVFSVAAIGIPFVTILTSSVTSVVMVDYSQYYRDGRLDDIVNLIHRSMFKCGLVIIPSMFLLFCVATELMRFLFGQQYESAATVFRVYLLMLPARTLTFAAVMIAVGKSRHVMVQSGLAVVANVVLVWNATGIFGAVGAAAATVVTLYFVTVCYYAFALRKVLKTPIRRLFPWRRLVELAVVGAIPAVVLMLLKCLATDLPDIVLLIAAGVLYGVLTLVLYSLLGWAKELAILCRTWLPR